MNITDLHRFMIPLRMAACCVIAYSVGAGAQEPLGDEQGAAVREGPNAALAFEKSFRDPDDDDGWRPIPLNQCENITALTKELWTKKQVLADFNRHRSEDQVGAIVIVKTEYCCEGSRLCAVTTACMEKKSTPLVGRFRVYAAWINNDPDRSEEEWSQWDEDVINEYEFIQGPGARLVVMVPNSGSKIYQWQTTASELDLNEWTFAEREGETPELESFLQTAVKFTAESTAGDDPSNN